MLYYLDWNVCTGVLPYLARADQVDDATDELESAIVDEHRNTDSTSVNSSSEDEDMRESSPLRPYHPFYGSFRDCDRHAASRRR